MTAPSARAGIRLANTADVAVIERLVRAAYEPYLARIGRRPTPMSDDYAALIAAGRVHAAVHEGEVVGVLVLLPEDAAMLLDNIAVAPHRHGQGFGRKLLAFAETMARSRGYAAIRLYTNERMVENIALYRRAGYVETHRGEHHGLHRVYMTKPLA